MTKSTRLSWVIGVKEPYWSVLGSQTVTSKVNLNLFFKTQVGLALDAGRGAGTQAGRSGLGVA